MRPNSKGREKLVERQVFETLAQSVEMLSNSGACRIHIEATTLGLFALIGAAQNAVLRVTGAPGIISQSEVEDLFKDREAAYDKSASLESHALWLHWRRRVDRFNSKVEAGWLVEPGKFFLERDRTGVICLGDSETDRPPSQCRAPRVPRVARSARPDTPTPAQLQALFDLPSERAQADASPAGS